MRNIYSYNIDDSEWTKKATLPWLTSNSQQKYYIKSAQYKDKLYLFVSTEVKTVSDIQTKLYIYDTKNDSFEEGAVLPDINFNGKTLPNRRQYSEISVVNDKIYLMGGRNFDGGTKILADDMEIFDLNTNEYLSSKKLPTDLTSYENFFSFSDGENLYIVDAIKNKVYEYDENSDNWSYIYDFINDLTNRYYYGLLNDGKIFNNKLYLVIGDNESENPDFVRIAKYDLNSRNIEFVTEEFEREPALRMPHLIYDGNVYTYGGDTPNLYSYYLDEVTNNPNEPDDPDEPDNPDEPDEPEELALELKANKAVLPLNEMVEITISASPNAELKATVNNQEVQINGNTIIFTSDEEGTFEVEVTATDENNSITKSISIVFQKDNYDVDLVLTAPSNEININSELIIKAEGTSDLNEVKFALDDAEISFNSDGEYKFIPTKIGLYTFKIMKDDRTIDSLNITVIDPSNNQVPTIKLNELNPNVVTEPTDLIGSISADGLVKYTLSYSKTDEDNFIVFKESSMPINNGIIGQIDPTILHNGFYKIRLTAYGSTKNVHEEILISVEGSMKIGNFSMDFKDMDIPVLNFPLTVIRSYDSRDRMISGDFGYGWNLNMNSAKLSESTSPHTGWNQVASGGFIRNYTIQELEKHEISINWGNGRTDKWAFRLNPMQQQIMPIEYVTGSYVPITKTKDKLEALDFSADILYRDNKLWTYGLEAYSPKRFKVTKEDGTIIVINKTDGIETITDTAGNVITFSKDGVTHSDGKSILFTRDSENRITSIKDPNNRIVKYAYDSNGNLTEVEDYGGTITKFEYDNKHYLTKVIDPRGVTTVKNEYDDEGRLIATIDPKGNRTEFTHDLENRQSIIKDRLGYSTIYE